MPTVFRIEDPEQRSRALAAAAPDALIPSRRDELSPLGQFSVGRSSSKADRDRPATGRAADRARLEAIVNRAHSQGLWVRFYTLNGHDAGRRPGLDRVATTSAALDAVRARWQRGDRRRRRSDRHRSVRRARGAALSTALTARQPSGTANSTTAIAHAPIQNVVCDQVEDRIRLRGAEERRCRRPAPMRDIGALFRRPAIAVRRRVGRQVEDRHEEPLENQVLAPRFVHLGASSRRRTCHRPSSRY